MIKMRKLQLRTISLILTLTILAGCVYSSAAADAVTSDHVDRQSGNLVERVYDSGNVTLSNQVKAEKNRIFTIKLNVKIKDIAKLPSQADAVVSDTGSSTVSSSVSSAVESTVDSAPVSSAPESAVTSAPASSDANSSVVSDSTSSVAESAVAATSSAPAAEVQPSAARTMMARAAVESQEETYEVRYYIQPGFEVVESSIPDTAVLEGGQYVSWPNLTAEGVSGFSTDLQLQAVAAEDGSDASAINTEDQSGVYQAGEPVYLFAQSTLQSVAQLPPIMAKTATLSSSANSWNTRTYDINLSVTAQSQLVSSTTPCDIILVLDRSGSMKDTLYTYSPIVGNPSTEDDSPNYYIALNGGYQSVSYTWSNRYKMYVWYYWSDDNNAYVYVSPLSGGKGEPIYIGSVQFLSYQFYTQDSQTQTKIQALKTAADQFAANVAANSSDSRIGVVSFGYVQDTTIVTNLNGKQLLKVGNSNSLTEIHRAINSLSPYGATAADTGLQMAKSLYDDTAKYEPVSTTTGRKKVVVFFTDGVPNHSGTEYVDSVANAAVAAAGTLKGAPYSASVYSIGLFSASTSQTVTFMNNVASYKPNSTTEKQYYPASDSTALNNIFDSISNEVGNIASATVTDVIDPRFELTAASRSALLADSNVTIVGNTIMWRNQSINVLKDAGGNLIPSWTKSFSIQAKAQFIGGNNIPTNVEATSGVTYGSSLFAKFPQPTVNVKAEFNVGNAENTIFNGEAVPTTTLGKYKVFGQDLFCGAGATGTFSYQWLKADGTTQIATSEAFPADNQFPADGTSYTLRASFDPGNPTTASTANSLGHVAGETAIAPGVKGPVSAAGQYTVHVVKGQLNLSKTITAKYPASDIVKANQSFVFKIQRYVSLADLNSQTNPETSYEVISLSDALTGNKTITGLKKGYYSITEQTGDAWRYTQTAVVDNDSSVGTTADTMVNIGRVTSASGAAVTTYFGTAADPATVAFTNTLTKGQWLGDTTVAVNTIRHAS